MRYFLVQRERYVEPLHRLNSMASIPEMKNAYRKTISGDDGANLSGVDERQVGQSPCARGGANDFGIVVGNSIDASRESCPAPAALTAGLTSKLLHDLVSESKIT